MEQQIQMNRERLAYTGPTIENRLIESLIANA